MTVVIKKALNIMRPFHGLIMGLVGAVVYLVTSSVNLAAQGMYYDEFFQAPASFAYKNIMPEMLAALSYNGVPILNMTYVGAIKSGFYGLYLVFFQSSFGVVSWRMLGLLFVGIGIFFFCVMTVRSLTSRGLLLFLLFFLTDTTMILATRHDEAPSALALMLRFFFIAVWIRSKLREKPLSIKSVFILGVLVGISIYEKLSSAVLILPLALILLFNKEDRSLRNYFASLAGVAIGIIPLIAANVISWNIDGRLISFSIPGYAVENDVKSFLGFMRFVAEYLSIADGVVLKKWILASHATGNCLEACCMGFLLLLTAILSMIYGKMCRFFRMSLVMLFCYCLIGVAMYFVPLNTELHHWIVGTPFQYAGYSLAFVGLFGCEPIKNINVKMWRVIFILLVVILLGGRLCGLVALEKSFIRGDASSKWDLSFTKIGHFAAQHAKESIFIAANRGLAVPIYCLSNGSPKLVYEPFWEYGGFEHIKRIIEESDRNTLYLVMNKVDGSRAEAALRVISDIETLPGWKEVPAENIAKELTRIELRKFLRNI